jgi:hypothetical protein
MADYKQILSRLTDNLNTLREREAKHAGNAPLDLLAQIRDHMQAIDLTEQAQQGQLSEIDTYLHRPHPDGVLSARGLASGVLSDTGVPFATARVDEVN